MTATLYWTARRCSAEAALTEMDTRWTILAASPEEFIVTSEPALPDRCYQFHAFDGTTELRWLADGDSGRAVWLAETAEPLPQPPTASRVHLDRLDTLAVLWGLPTPDPADQGMSVWREARIGTARYPCPPGTGPHDRAVLRGMEYVAIADRHGNAAVVERRLVAIETVDLSGPRS